ncbi:MAG TPA: 3'(2'),5'-bisphosphate nucleotidase CysQ [Stellaceae bacterium]|jgi:3'(2'), 5'-bisphosphate nucleotidase|nr:3'(2'),5'-bisphosphate nucleotidase CysQ [Stellaceae bacterium]
MNSEYQDLIEVARNAAREAAIAIMRIVCTEFEVQRKLDDSPVTLADTEAEHIIVGLLKAAAPSIPVVAEEHAAAHGLPDVVAPRFWLVDPLDGTRGFVELRDEYSVNIGLVENGRAVLGIIGVPNKGLIYTGAGSGTATRQSLDGKPEPIAARRPPAKPVVVTSRMHGPSRKIAAFMQTVPSAEQKPMGSAYKFCLLAEGSADHYPRYGNTSEWDTAAGQAILEAAGGSVVTLEGAPFVYGKPKYLNPGFIAHGRP